MRLTKKNNGYHFPKKYEMNKNVSKHQVMFSMTEVIPKSPAQMEMTRGSMPGTILRCHFRPGNLKH